MTRVVVPSKRPSPPAGKAADTLGFSPPIRASGATSDTVVEMPTQTPAEQVSPVVAGLRSLHGSVFAACTHPLVGLHESFVHTFVSSQLTGGPAPQLPAEQVSPVVQAFPSLQATVLFVCWQPSSGSQESVVQTFVSLQLPGACWQPRTGSQESVVQAFASLQFTAVPATQAPATQVLAAVHAVPALHAAPLASAVPVQAPFAHASPVVHALLSLHPMVLLVCWQPSSGSQESVVQTFVSLQLPGACWQPRTRSQESVVQAFASLQFTADRKSTRLNSSHLKLSRMPSSA